MDGKKLVITILSDSPFIPTGYSDQAKQLAIYLSNQGHTIHFLANSYQGANIVQSKLEDGVEFNFKIYGSGYQPYFGDKISQHLKDTKSDIFLILLDTFMLMQPGGNLPFGWFLNIDCSPAQTIFWFPSDGGGGLPINCQQILQKVECPVAMAKFGQKQVKDYYNINTEYVPHGTDTELFKRLSDEERYNLRLKYNLVGKFVIGVVARNQPRKFLDRTLKAMSLIKDKIPNAILFLHLDPNDPAQVFNMKSLISRYNLENRVIFSGVNALKGIPRKQMPEIYNLFDVFFLSTSGEGFGIPIIEAMSCEVPVLATDYTSTPELVKEHNAGLGINLAGVDTIDMFKTNLKDYDNLVMNGTITGSWEVERGICDVNDACNKILHLYNNPELIKEMGKNGRKAVLENYDFKKSIGTKFEEIMLKLSSLK